MAGKDQGEKFPLLIYRRWARMLCLPSLLIAVASGVAWWFAPDISLLADHDWVPIVIGLVGALIFVYSLGQADGLRAMPAQLYQDSYPAAIRRPLL